MIRLPSNTLNEGLASLLMSSMTRFADMHSASVWNGVTEVIEPVSGLLITISRKNGNFIGSSDELDGLAFNNPKTIIKHSFFQGQKANAGLKLREIQGEIRSRLGFSISLAAVSRLIAAFWVRQQSS